MDLFAFFEKWIWLGFAAVGFAMLFNVPKRTLITIFILGAIGGAVKLLTIQYEGNIVIGSFFGAVVVGFLSVWVAHIKHAPPFVFAIPAVIPMVPGAFSYKMMLGIIKLTSNTDETLFIKILNDTISNGLKAFFILLLLAVGVSAPMILTRRESAKDIKVKLQLTHEKSIKK
ncbi:threonine/serine exporter family protein [Lutibacter citreus]|uniref:threonine/serine exporter family protein n=1 Tax=Lutibacter citreus TaxID=2138210 RepID=UPI000DBE76DA|nr:threonine/serine exporter family protein [Lutibacter citreus]